MQAEQIAKSLGNAKRANGQWVASCPVPSHGKGNGDKNPSLSISISDEGKPLFHCHGGCSQEEVFQTIRARNLLPELLEKPDPLANIRPIPRNKIEQEWVYLDEDKVPVFVKVRYRMADNSKTYRLYKLDANGRKMASLADARIVPYNLPALLDAKTAGRNVFLVEGEKAAEAIKSIGMIATTAHTGAGSWPEAITEYFAGAQVIIVPDNDVAGWGYAHKAAEAILPIVKSLKVVDLGLQGQGDDAFEFIEAGGGRVQLVALVKAAPIITSLDQVTMPERLNPIINSASLPSSTTPLGLDIAKEFESEPKPKEAQPPPKPLKTIKIESWDEIQDEPVEWLIEGVIPVGSFTALYGPPGSFKSFHALHIAHCVATGTPWMGREVTKSGAVLYLAGEGFGGIGARIKACKIHHETAEGAQIYIVRHQLNLRSSAEDFNALMQAVVQLAEQTGIEFSLAIVDTLARAFGGGNENDTADMMAFVVSMGKIQEFLSCALMVLHHSGKDVAKGMRGSSSLLGAVDTELELLRFDEQMKGVLTVSKQKDGVDNERFGFEMVEVEIRSAGLSLSDPVVSLAVQASDLAVNETPRKAKNNAGKGKNQSIQLMSLEAIAKEKGTPKFIDGFQRQVVNLIDWKAEFRSRKGVTDDSTATEKRSFDKAWSRAQDDLQKSGEIGIRDKLVWLMPFKSNVGQG